MYERLPEHLRDLVEAPPGDWSSESGRNDRHRAICSVVNFLVAHELDTDWLVDTEFSAGASDGRRRTARSVARAIETFDPALYGRVAEDVDLDVHYRLLDLVTGSDGRSKVMRAIIEKGTTEQIEAILLSRLAGTWTPHPPTEDDDLEYHRLYALWQGETG